MAYIEIYGSANHTVRHRFTCEHCGKDSDWRETKFSVQHQAVGDEVPTDKEGFVTNKGKEIAKRNAAAAAFKKLQDKLGRVLEQANHGEYHEFSGYCPHCKKVQTWAVKGAFFHGLSLSLLAGFAVFVCVLGYRLLFGEFAMKWMGIIPGCVFLIVFIPLTIAYMMDRAQVKGVANPQKPTIDWNGWFFPAEHGDNPMK